MIKDIRICFVGDSFVNGTGDETSLGWAGRLCASVSTSITPITYYNLGIRRNTSEDILHRWKNECDVRLPESCDARIVLSCGVNDTVIENGKLRVPLESSIINIKIILKGMKKYKLIMVGPPPIDDYIQNTRIETISKAFENEAKKLGIPFIELYSSLINDKSYRHEISNNDGAHPQSNGYSKISAIIASSSSWWFKSP